MRSVLVDRARRRNALRRGAGAERVPLDDVVACHEERSTDLVVLNDALERLGQVDAALVRIVELRFFAGLSIRETADVLGISTSTVERAWRSARAWLRLKLQE